MSLKDILVYADGSKAAGARIDFALALAGEHEAHVLGLYVDPGLAMPIFPEVPTAAVTEIMDRIREERDEARGAAREQFESAAKRSGVAYEWRESVGEIGSSTEIVGTLATHSRYTDLVVVGQTSGDEPKYVPGGLPDALVMSAGRPVLVVPYIGPPKRVAKHVLVAWNNTRESVRAVNDALPLLTHADKVEVISVNPADGDAPEGELAGADIALHLARHGVKAETHRTIANDVDVGDILLSRAADFDADLIVMGAYGHSRLREMVLGGATRHLLQHMTVPVVMSH